MKQLVVLERCPDYSATKLKTTLQRTLQHLGGIERFVKPGKTILLKPNLLRKAKPEEAVTTHPAFVQAVVELVQGAGGRVIIGDSPGAALPHSRNTLVKLYRICGLEKVARETGAELCLETEYEMVHFPQGRMVKRIETIKPALRADFIINLPKFKTHVYTRLTGAVKNLFGLVPGLIKPTYHAKLADVVRFSSMLVDVMELAGSGLTIVDGIWGMEGEGPGSGPRRKMGLVVAGESPPAVDVVLSQIMGIDPLSVPTTKECLERKMLPGDLSEIETRGVNLSDVIQKNFSVPTVVTRGMSFANLPFWLKPVLPVAKRLLTTRPRVIRKTCTGCGDCARVCPVNTITINNGKATINYSNCIRCFCCQETCSRGAVVLVRPILQHLFM